jgi:hypothetical protein
MSALFDFPSLLVVILLFICTMTFVRSLYPNIFDTVDNSNKDQNNQNNSFGTPSSQVKHVGLYGLCWKASRIGERLSPYIGVACAIMAIHILFIKA